MKLSGKRSLTPLRLGYTSCQKIRNYSISEQGSRQKKLSKKRPPAALEQSSLYEDVVEPNLPKINDMMARVAEKRRGEQLEEKQRESSDKENSQSESENSAESPRKKASEKESKVGEKTKKGVGRTYYGKKGPASRGSKDEGEEEEGISKKKVPCRIFLSRTISPC